MRYNTYSVFKEVLKFKLVMKFQLQANVYFKILSRDDHNNEIRCQATNPLFDNINAKLKDPSDGYSDIKVFNVTCK